MVNNFGFAHNYGSAISVRIFHIQLWYNPRRARVSQRNGQIFSNVLMVGATTRLNARRGLGRLSVKRVRSAPHWQEQVRPVRAAADFGQRWPSGRITRAPVGPPSAIGILIVGRSGLLGWQLCGRFLLAAPYRFLFSGGTAPSGLRRCGSFGVGLGQTDADVIFFGLQLCRYAFRRLHGHPGGINRRNSPMFTAR